MQQKVTSEHQYSSTRGSFGSRLTAHDRAHQILFVPTLNVGTWLDSCTWLSTWKYNMKAEGFICFQIELYPSGGLPQGGISTSARASAKLRRRLSNSSLTVRGTKYVNQLSHLVTCESLQVLCVCDLESRTHWDGSQQAVFEVVFGV